MRRRPRHLSSRWRARNSVEIPYLGVPEQTAVAVPVGTEETERIGQAVGPGLLPVVVVVVVVEVEVEEELVAHPAAAAEAEKEVEEAMVDQDSPAGKPLASLALLIRLMG